MPATDTGDRTAIPRRVLLALIAVLAAWAATVALTGGFDLRPYAIPFRSTNQARPAYAALALAAVYVALFRAHAARHVSWLQSRAERLMIAVASRGAYVALIPAATIFVLAMIYGVHVAGGSDSYGYVSQADLWLARDLVTEQPIATAVPWPEAGWTFAPLAYRPAVEPGAIVPVYAPGLPVLMGLGKVAAGDCGPYLIVPLLGALLVWLTYWLGAQLWSPLLGVGSAVLMATSPAFLFMVMNPMSDVPVSTFFVAGLVTALSRLPARAFWTGILASVAIFIRPNLVPLGAIFLALVLVRAPQAQRWRDFLAFGVGGLPLVLVVAAVNTHLYGAPWKAGYGSLDQYYSWSFPATNVSQYAAWLWQTETPLVVLMLAPLLLLRWIPRERRTGIVFAALFAAGVWLSYLFYQPFDAWWYLRFLLPAFPPMLVLAAIGLALLLQRVGGAQRAVALGLLVAVPLFAWRISNDRERGVLTLWQGGVVYVSAAEYVRTALPPNAVMLTVQHSGSIRHYADRLTLRWDLLPSGWWPRALDVLVERGYRPYLLVSSFEEAQLREHFALSDAVEAPGTLVATMDHPEQIRIYDPLRQTSRAPERIAPVVPCPCGPSWER